MTAERRANDTSVDPAKRRPGGGCRTQLLASRTIHVCHYCRERLEPGVNLTVDHIVPRAAGGLDRWWNLAVCCVDCNALKASRRWHPDCKRCRKAWRRWAREGKTAEIRALRHAENEAYRADLDRQLTGGSAGESSAPTH